MSPGQGLTYHTQHFAVGGAKSVDLHAGLSVSGIRSVLPLFVCCYHLPFDSDPYLPSLATFDTLWTTANPFFLPSTSYLVVEPQCTLNYWTILTIKLPFCMTLSNLSPARVPCRGPSLADYSDQ